MTPTHHVVYPRKPLNLETKPPSPETVIEWKHEPITPIECDESQQVVSYSIGNGGMGSTMMAYLMAYANTKVKITKHVFESYFKIVL